VGRLKGDPQPFEAPAKLVAGVLQLAHVLLKVCGHHVERLGDAPEVLSLRLDAGLEIAGGHRTGPLGKLLQRLRDQPSQDQSERRGKDESGHHHDP
jgi:hypothetical protein